MTETPGFEQPTRSGNGTGASSGGAGGRSFAERLIAALKLDASVYEEVEHDPAALGQAAGVVGLAAVAGAIGAAGVVGVGGMLAGILGSFVAWALWTTLVWIIGVKVFDHTSDFEELLRTLGFVSAPQILLVLAVIPLGFLQALLGLVVLGMTVVAFVRAVRQALDVESGRAVLVSVIAVVAYALVLAAFGALAG